MAGISTITMHATKRVTNAERELGALKAAELLSTVGAAVLGAGLALLIPRLADQAVALLMTGLLVHGLGMGVKHRLQQGQPQPRWSRRLVAACWVWLGVLAAALAWHILWRG